jgi:hypothetical protein
MRLKVLHGFVRSIALIEPTLLGYQCWCSSKHSHDSQELPA